MYLPRKKQTNNQSTRARPGEARVLRLFVCFFLGRARAARALGARAGASRLPQNHAHQEEKKAQHSPFSKWKECNFPKQRSLACAFHPLAKLPELQPPEKGAGAACVGSFKIHLQDEGI